jgi:hypothetical protein
MKTKLEIVVLAAIVVAIGLYLALREGDRTHYSLPTLPSVGADKISKIQIEGPQGSLTLEKRDTRWRIVPEDYPADPEKVDRVLEAVGDLTLTALVSETESYGRYELDDARKVSLRAWDGDRLVREVDIGKAAGTFQHTHVKLPGDPNVYHARGDFRMTVDKPMADFRDPSVMTFDAGAATSVQIQTAGGELRFDAKAETPEGREAGGDAESGEETPPAKVWSAPDGPAADAESLEAIVDFMAGLKADGFLEADPGKDGEEPAYRITVTAGEKTHTLSVYDAGEEAGSFPATASDSPYPFELSRFDGDDLRNHVDTLTKPPAPEEGEDGGGAPSD